MPPHRTLEDDNSEGEESPYSKFFEEVDWKRFLKPDAAVEIQNLNRNEKVSLVISLIIFLHISLASIFFCLFASRNSKIKQLASVFLRHQKSATPGDDYYFPAGTLFLLWHKRFKNCRNDLHEYIIKPYALKLVKSESDRGISDPDLKVKLSKLTMKDIRDILDPGRLLDKYKVLFPFTYNLLFAFTASPNRHRKYNLIAKDRKTLQGQKKDDDELEDDGLEEDEVLDDLEDGGWLDWRSDPRWAGFSRCPLHALVLVFSIMLFVRNRATNFLPVVFGIFLKIGGASSRIISVFSKMGVCSSDRTIELVKERLSADAVQQAVNYVKSGQLFYILFDNVNLYLRKYEQRLQNRNFMLHLTNAAIMPIKMGSSAMDSAARDLTSYLGTIGKRYMANPADFMPTAEDDDKMDKSFKALIVHFIIAYTPGAKNWEGRREMRERANELIQHDRPLPEEKSPTFPFGVFDVNEGSRAGVGKVMDEIRLRSGLSEEKFSGEARVVQGDFLTVHNLRLLQKERFDDAGMLEQVKYALPLGALWHTGFNAVKMIVKTHKGEGSNLLDPAALRQHKDLLGRTWDINDPEYAPAKSLIRHSLIARVLDIVMMLMSFSTWADLSNWRPTFDNIVEVANQIVENFSNSMSARSARLFGDDYLARSILFIRDALLFCEFESAVSFADAGRVLHVLKYWVFSFRGAGMHNYARECLEVLVKWKYELTEAHRVALERAWFVNRFGLKGRWIAADLYLEQLNYWIKRVFIAQGSNLTARYIIEKGSACVEAFLQISEHVSKLFGNAERKRRHKEVSFYHDLEAIVNDLLHKSIHRSIGNREVPPPKTKEQKTMDSEKDETEKFSLPGERPTGVVDVFVKGATMLQEGKFFEFVEDTIIDPELGYPLTETTTADATITEAQGQTGIADERELEDEDERAVIQDPDIHDVEQEVDCPGFGGLGGGGEYA